MFTIEADISKQIQKLNRFQRLAIPEAQKQTFYKFGFVHKNYDMKRYMQKVFNNPVPFTLNSVLYKNKKKQTSDKEALEQHVSSLSGKLEITQQDFFTEKDVKAFSFTEIYSLCSLFNLKLSSIELKKTKRKQAKCD